MVKRSGFASIQMVIDTPLTNRGPINGMKTTVPTATSGTRAAAKLMSPLALSTNSGRNGAAGAIQKRSKPITKGSARGRAQTIK